MVWADHDIGSRRAKQLRSVELERGPGHHESCKWRAAIDSILSRVAPAKPATVLRGRGLAVIRSDQAWSDSRVRDAAVVGVVRPGALHSKGTGGECDVLRT